MNNTITITFKTDRQLTADEIEMIAGAVLAQVEEPVDYDGCQIDVNITDVKSRHSVS